MPPIRVALGVAAAAALSVLGALESYKGIAAFSEANPDLYRIAAQRERFREAARVLPRNAVLGYLSDLPSTDAAGSAGFLAAQYLLAPRLLTYAKNQPLVLGNFSKPLDFAALGRAQGLTVDRDFGGGVLLFRKEGR